LRPTLANASQLRDYTMVVPEASDRISQVIKNMVGVILLLLPLYVYMILNTCFPYRDL
jgi:hypothetical protein